jgi:glycosyltransferase involved in cell wall biosynthesis
VGSGGRSRDPAVSAIRPRRDPRDDPAGPQPAVGPVGVRRGHPGGSGPHESGDVPAVAAEIDSQNVSPAGRDHRADRHDLEDYQKALHGSNARLECIPNGVPAWQLPPAALESKVLVAAGRLVPQKGFDLLLDAFGKVSARHPDWHLWIFGSGADRDSLAAQIDRLGLTGRAHLKGTTGQLDKRLAEASVFVLSSRFEGCRWCCWRP